MSLRNISGLGVFALILAVFVGGMAFAPAFAVSNDTETSTTSSTSDVTSTTTVTLNDSKEQSFVFQATGMDADGKLVLMDDEGDVLYENTSPTAVNASAGHYKFNVSDDKLRGGEYDADGTQVTAKYVNNTTVSSPTTSTFTFTLEDASDDAKVVVGSEQANVSDDITLSDNTRSIAGIISMGEKSATVGLDDITVTNNTSTVSVEMKDSNVSERVSVASDLSSKVPIVENSVQVNGKTVPVYQGSAPSSASGTYVVHSGGEYTVHLPDDYSKSSVDVTVSSQGLNVQDYLDVYGVSMNTIDDIPRVVSSSLPF